MYNYFPDRYIWTIRANATINESYLGGGSYGEIAQVIGKINSKDPDSWRREWENMGDKVRSLAENAESEGLRQISEKRYLRASNYYLKAELFLKPDDPKRADIYQKALQCFHGGIKTMPNIEDVKIPYENSYLPAYFVNASRQGEKQPLLVMFNGLDGTAEKKFFHLTTSLIFTT